MISKDGLFREYENVFGIIRYSGDSWQKNTDGSEKIWSVATLETAIALSSILAFMETVGIRDEYASESQRYGRFIERVKGFYAGIPNIPEQFFNDGSFSSAQPLGWSHALRYSL